MPTFSCRALAIAGLVATLRLAGAAADAVTLRWAGRGDMQTTDPHSQNENLTNNINSLIYEYLVTRDKQLGIIPALAESWTQLNPTTWRFKLRPGVKFHDGTPFTADDVVFSFERAKTDTSQLARLCECHGPGEEDRRPHRRVRHIRAEPDDAGAYRHHQHHVEGLEREEPGDQAAELHAEGGHDHGQAGQRHRSVHAGGARARHQDGAEEESELVGHQGRILRGERRRRDLHAHRLRRDARGGAHFRRGRSRQRPAAAGRAAPRPDSEHQGAGRRREPHRLHRHGPEPRRTPLLQRQGQESLQGQARAAGALRGHRHRRHPEDDDARPVEAFGRAAAQSEDVLARDRETPALRPRGGEEAAGRRGVPQRLRGHARLSRTTAT